MKSGALRTTTSLLALAGIADAAYLTLQHYQGKIPPCTVEGCEQVLSSEYATVIGIPVALFGLGYYLALLVLSRLGTKQALGLQLLLVSLGLLASAYLIYLQLEVIGAICIYCMASAIVTAAIWILTIATIHDSGGTNAK